jgi:hypothetical protein
MRDIFISFLGSVAVVLLLYFLYWLSSRSCSRNRAYAQCWWLPGWNCFRFVIRNMHSKVNLICVRHRAWLRATKPPITGCSVKSFVDTEITSGERILLPNEQDLPVLCFRLENNGNRLVHTDK